MKPLSDIEIKEISNRTKAMREDEKRLVLMNLPTRMLNEEIVRRTDVAMKKLNGLFEILGTVNTELTLEEMQEVLADCKEVLQKG